MRVVANCLMAIVYLIPIFIDVISGLLVDRFFVFHDQFKQALYQTSLDIEDFPFVKVADGLHEMHHIVIDLEIANTVLYVLDVAEPNVIHAYGLVSPSWHSTFRIDISIAAFDKFPNEMVFVMANQTHLALGVFVGHDIDRIDLETIPGIVQIHVNKTDKTNIMILLSREDSSLGSHRSSLEIYNLIYEKRKVIGEWSMDVSRFEVDFEGNDLYLMSNSTILHCKLRNSVTDCNNFYNSSCTISSSTLSKGHLFFACLSTRIFSILRNINVTNSQVKTNFPLARIGAMRIVEVICLEYVDFRKDDNIHGTEASIARSIDRNHILSTFIRLRAADDILVSIRQLVRSIMDYLLT